MKLLLFLFLAAVQLSAATLIHTVTVSDTRPSAPGEPWLHFSGIANVPKFDPALGELTSGSFVLTINGSLNWQFTHAGQAVVWVAVNTDFPGAPSNAHFSPMVLFVQSCKTVPCAPTITDLHAPMADLITISGKLLGPPYAYTGPGTLTMPISSAVSGIKEGDRDGALQGQQKIEWKLVWTYTYTPR